MFRLVEYQRKTVERLQEAFTKAWSAKGSATPIVLKSPTGSGKTIMIAQFLGSLNHLPNWDADRAYVWITFSETLALQSRDKLAQFFGESSENRLLTVEDIDTNQLQKNDILFLNWQKVVSKSAENRKLRRPDDPLRRKEQGQYFEDFIDSARSSGRQLVMLIDESHTNVTPTLAQEIIDYIGPKVVVHISATPKPETVAASADLGTYVNVSRDDVVEAGLIKERIIIQTSEDLARFKGQDFDHTLLDLGLERREHLSRLYKSLGKNINPLLLIQLPNDDSSTAERGESTKEQVVTEYLRSKGIDESRIARWFDDHAKPDLLEQNDDHHDILLFKLAASTGWDCPRAQVLVMFRNVKVEQRYIQTIGRILRMPDPHNLADYKDFPELRSGYLYTNYERRDVVQSWNEVSPTQALYQTVYRRIGDDGVKLLSEFRSRTDYGDLSSSSKFQSSFVQSLKEYFELESIPLVNDRLLHLEKAGFDTQSTLSSKVLVDAEFTDFDKLGLDFSNGNELEVEISSNDLEKTFNLNCWNLLKEQTEEDVRVGNIARSWSPLKSALRIWMKNAFGSDTKRNYEIALTDLAKGPKSLLRPAVTFALRNYRPILDSIIAARAEGESNTQQFEFSIAESYSFPANFELLQTKLCALESFAYDPDAAGSKNELAFVEYLESSESQIDWWFKQGVGREYFAVKYTNSTTGQESLFYPDWIVKLRNGKVLITDTKAGFTASNTEGRAQGLARYVAGKTDQLIGGISVFRNGVWEFSSLQDGDLDSNWVPLESILS